MATTIDGTKVGAHVVLSHAFFQCTKCHQVKPAADFGFRKMTGTTTIRNQAQCTKCRGQRKTA